jgi:hypothetical protein
MSGVGARRPIIEGSTGILPRITCTCMRMGRDPIISAPTGNPPIIIGQRFTTRDVGALLATTASSIVTSPTTITTCFTTTCMLMCAIVGMPRVATITGTCEGMCPIVAAGDELP